MIKVLHKAFDLLESMALAPERAFTLSELAYILKEKPTTCANIVKTMCQRGYLTRLEPKGYVLGPVARGLQFSDILDTRLMEAAREPMSELVASFSASGVLAVLRRGKKKILDDYASPSDVVINRTVRKSHELYTTSTGLILTALSGVIPQKNDLELIENTFGSQERFREHCSFIHRNHYIAISLRKNILEIAAAVYHGDEFAAVIAVYLPEFMVNANEKIELIASVREASRIISERMQSYEPKSHREDQVPRL